MIPPQMGVSILPNVRTLRRVNLRRDSSTSPGRSASKSVLWQNRWFIELIYGAPYNSRRRAPGKNAEGGQENRGRRPRESSRQRRARASVRRLPPLGLLGSDSRSPRLV